MMTVTVAFYWLGQCGSLQLANRQERYKGFVFVIELPKPLVEAVSGGRATLFLGAGASREAGFPTAYELGEILVEKSGLTHVSGRQRLDIVAQTLYDNPNFGRNWVYRTIAQVFENKTRTAGRPVSIAHEQMTKLTWRSIFTTNFDRLVEISYDTTDSSVQSCLPIYSPSAILKSHESSRVKLIKLNGSIDEYLRNPSHKLVLTFRDQQDIRQRNEDFYELFRDEAVTGPVIFVGFGLAHPGVDIGIASSPEFMELRNLVAQLGGAYYPHYVVMPFEVDSSQSRLFIEDLSSMGMVPLNMKFGAFTQALTEALSEIRAVSSVSADPVVRVGPNSTLTVSRTEYTRDLRHFTLLSSDQETLSPPTIKETLNGQYDWGSFFHNHAIVRDESNSVRNHLTQTANDQEVLLLTAPAGWGKTFLLRQLAVEAARRGQPVFWLNPYSTVEIPSSNSEPVLTSMWDSDRIGTLLAQIDEKSASSATRPILVADNCSERANEVSEDVLKVERMG